MHTINEVAERFGVHFQTVRNWIRAGELNVFKHGRTVRITDEELKAFIERNQKKE